MTATVDTLRCIPPLGRLDAPILILQDCPSQLELQEKRHLLPGPTRTLQRKLKGIGVAPHDCRLEFFFSRPPENAKEAKALSREIAKPFRERILASPHEDIIILGGNSPFVTRNLGQLALAALLGKTKILPWASYRQTIIPLNGKKIFPIYHPTAALRMPQFQESFDRDIARFGRWRGKPFHPPEDSAGRKLHYPETLKEVENLLPLFRKEGTASKPLLAFDVETTYDDGVIWDKRLTCWAVSNGAHTMSVPYSTDMHGENSHWTVSEEKHLISLFRDLFQNARVITQNGPAFDHIVAESYGFPVQDWEDTCNLAHVLHGHLPKALAFLSSFYLDIPPWKEVPHTTDMRAHRLYNCQDTLYTYLVYRELESRLKEGR